METPEGKVPAADESLARLRWSAQLHKEVIFEQEEDNFKATNMWSNSQKSEEYEFKAIQKTGNSSEESSCQSKESIEDLYTP